MKMKRIIIVLCSIILSLSVVSITGCYDDETPTSASSDGQSETATEESSETGGLSDSESLSVATYSVTFDSDGGTAVAGITVKSGEKIEKPREPAKATLEEQYSFEGWYLGDRLWDFENDTVTENIVLKAKWKLNGKYSIPFVK